MKQSSARVIWSTRFPGLNGPLIFLIAASTRLKNEDEEHYGHDKRQ
jgi:hypothetical protein